MIDVTRFAGYAQLAEASYVLWDQLPSLLDQTVELALQNSDLRGEFAAAQAIDFVQLWSVVHSIPNTASGFSATLFESKGRPGEVVLALRGSDQLIDDRVLTGGGDIVLDGIALDQVVDLYNYWRSLTTKGSYTAAKLVTLQAETQALQDAYLFSSTTGAQLEAQYRVQGLIIDYGVGPLVRAIELGASDTLLVGSDLASGSGAAIGKTLVSATGHSLGGHLAAAFTRLFPETGADALAVNGAGFATNSNVDKLFALLGGGSAFDASKLVSVYGSAGPQIVAQDWYLQQQGGHEEIYTESAGPSTTLGHGKEQMTESLALYSLFATLAPTLNTSGSPGIQTISGILETSSNVADRSLENALDALRKLFDPATSSATATDDRENYYLKLKILQDTLKSSSYNSGTAELPQYHFQIESLTARTVNELILAATIPDPTNISAIAYRYALASLNPFAVIGADYTIHNQDGALDLYRPHTGEGTLTETWLRDRAEFLVEVLQYNVNDGPSPWLAGLPDFSIRRKYRDEERDLTLGVNFGRGDVYFGKASRDEKEGSSGRSHLYGMGGDDELRGRGGNDHIEGGVGNDELFGDAGDDTLIGGSGDDHLDGGAGIDTLRGDAGNDTLVGGADNDYLYGGTGFDSYVCDADGVDVIRDADGWGVIHLRGADGVERQVSGGKRIGESMWQSDDRQVLYALARNWDGTDRLTVHGGGGQVIVENFQNGALGIQLADAEPEPPAPPSADREIRGDLAPMIFDNPDLNAPLPDGYRWTQVLSTDYPYDYFLIDDLDNFARDPDKPWTVGGQTFHGGDGSDYMVASDGGSTLSGRDGDDHLVGGLSSDTLGAGAGNDFLVGGNYEGPYEADALVYPSGEIIVGGPDDLLLGGPGDDVLVAGLEEDIPGIVAGTGDPSDRWGDFLVAAAGDDLLYGSAAHDALFGGWGKDTLYGGPGGDLLNGDDTYVPGHPTFVSAGRWKFELAPGTFAVSLFPVIETRFDTFAYYRHGGDDDRLFGGDGDDILLGMSGNDLLHGEGGDDVISGWEGADALHGGGGDDLMAGDFGVYEQPGDRLAGFLLTIPAGAVGVFTQDVGDIDLQGADYLDGGDGNDTLYGEGGNDTLFGGSGNDSLWGDANYLPAELHGADYLDGGDGDDQLFGGGGGDTLLGGTGDDLLDGGDGGDTYIYGLGDGADVIDDWGNEGIDRLILRDLGRGDVSIFRGADGGIEILAPEDGRILINVYSNIPFSGIEEIRFADGSELDAIALAGLPVDPVPSAGADWTTGSDGDDVIDTVPLMPSSPGEFILVDAGAGDDEVYGWSATVAFGGAGDDRLYDGVRLLGGAGNDELHAGTQMQGGEGDDLLVGGNEYNRFVFADGETGHDLIRDESDFLEAYKDWYYRDQLRIDDWQDREEGAGSYRVPGYWFDGPDFQVGEDVAAWLLDPDAVIEDFPDFDDLTEWEQTAWSRVKADIQDDPSLLQLVEGLPELPALAANDFAALALLQDAGALVGDALVFPESFSLSQLNPRLLTLLSVSPASGYVEAYAAIEIDMGGGQSARILIPHADDGIGSGVESFVFADGATLPAHELLALLGPDVELDPQDAGNLIDLAELTTELMGFGISGRGGNDTIFGSEYDEELHGDAGNDSLSGGGGMDGLYGGEGDDILQGGAGEDYLEGGPGSDTYIFNSGDGQDWIWEDPADPGLDLLQFGEGITPDMISLGLGSLAISVGNDGDVIHLTGFDPEDPYTSLGFERFRFADGTEWDGEMLMSRGIVIGGSADGDDLFGTAANDRIFGFEGDDWLYGGVGDDLLSGGDGADIYHFGVGDGIDVMNDSGASAEIDVVEFAPDILPEYILLQREGDDIVASIGAGGDAIRLLNWNDPNDRIEELRFADGAVWGIEVLGALFETGPELVEPIADQPATEDALFDFAVPGGSFSIPAGTNHVFSATLANGDPLPVWLTFDPLARRFSGTPGNDEVGSHHVLVRVVDEEGREASDEFVISVVNVNDAPEPVADSVTISADAGAASISGAWLLSNDQDVDRDDSLVLIAVTGSVAGASVILDDGTVTYDSGDLFRSLGAGAVFADTFQYSISDLDGAVANATVSVTITGVNDAPTLEAAFSDLTAIEGSMFEWTLPAGAFLDVDAGDTLTYSTRLAEGSELPDWLSFDPVSGRLRGTPGGADIGALALRITATDSAGASAFDEFELNVLARPGLILTGTAGRDVLAGGEDGDTINGGRGNDLLFGNADTDSIDGEEGNDILHGGSGSDELAGGSGNDAIFAGDGDDALSGEDGNDLLHGDSGRDLLRGGLGNDWMFGGSGSDLLLGEEGNDYLLGESGSDLLHGGAGDDLIRAGAGNDLILGHHGNDRIETGPGQDVVLFNRGDGRDRMIAADGTPGTLSLGGGIAYEDLSLRKQGNHLVLEAGDGASVTFEQWYGRGGNKTVSMLQVVVEAMLGYDPASADPLYDQKIEIFDFLELVARFDSARVADLRLDRWAAMNALLDVHLGGSDTEAIGGEPAYRYGLDGSLSGIAIQSVRPIIEDSRFGASPQPLGSLQALNAGQILTA